VADYHQEAVVRDSEREFFIDNLLVRMHFIIIVMIRWTGLAPWEFEFPFPGSLTSTFLNHQIPATKLVADYHHEAEVRDAQILDLSEKRGGAQV